jgi:nitroreductase
LPTPAINPAVLEAVEGRRSIRQFLDRPVDEQLVARILDAAARAPSGQNMQPWLVHHVTGKTRDRLCEAVSAAAAAGKRSDDYAYFPKEIREPYVARRRKVGYDLFEIYGIAREDFDGRKRALFRNFQFFGAPVGLFFTMERDWGLGAWIDIGNYMTNVMTLARGAGLETCPQQAWAEYAAPVREILSISDSHVLVSGMALGYADYDAKVNALVAEREPASRFVTRHI